MRHARRTSDRISPLLPWFLLLLSVSAAHADILFIDANFAESEVAAARKAAQARGEKLIVIPDDRIPASAFPEMEKVKVLEMNYHERLIAASEGKPMIEKPTDAKLLSEMADIQAKYGFSAGDVETRLSQLQGAHITSLVLSGHSEGTLLQGMLLKGDETVNADTSLYIDQIKDAMVSAKLGNDLRSVYVWGCYGMTKGHALDWKQWKSDFPQMSSFSMGFGFDLQAPSSPAILNNKLQGPDNGPELLGSLLTDEAKLEKIKDQKQLLAAVKSLPGMRAGLGLAAFVNDYYLSADHDSVNCMSDLPGDCMGKISYMTHQTETVYASYVPTNENAQDLPSSSDDGSKLRQYYNQLQQSSYCLGHCSNSVHLSQEVQNNIMEAGLNPSAIPCPTDVIKLIEHDPVFSNFLRWGAKEIHADDAALAGNPDVQKQFERIFVHPASDQPRLILQEAGAFSNAFMSAPGIPNDARNKAWSFLSYAQTVLVLNPSCVPFSWIEDQQHPEPPLCTRAPNQ